MKGNLVKLIDPDHRVQVKIDGGRAVVLLVQEGGATFGLTEPGCWMFVQEGSAYPSECLLPIGFRQENNLCVKVCGDRAVVRKLFSTRPAASATPDQDQENEVEDGNVTSATSATMVCALSRSGFWICAPLGSCVPEVCHLTVIRSASGGGPLGQHRPSAPGVATSV